MEPEDFFDALKRLHAEVTLPEFEKLRADMRAQRDEMLTGFDRLYKRADVSDTEMVMVRGALTRLEQRVAALEEATSAMDKKLDQFALRAELVELEEQLHEVESRIEQIKAHLNEH